MTAPPRSGFFLMVVGAFLGACTLGNPYALCYRDALQGRSAAELAWLEPVQGEPRLLEGPDPATLRGTAKGDGYAFLGSADFEAGALPDALLAAQAKRVHAALVTRTREPNGLASRTRYLVGFWGKARPGPLGVEYRDLSAAERASTGVAQGGVVVTAVVKDSPAGTGGLRPGDVVLSFDAEPVVSAEKLGALLTKRAGEATQLDVLRGSERRVVNVTLRGAHLAKGATSEDALPRLEGGQRPP